MTASQVEIQELNLVAGKVNYLSDTSVYFDDLVKFRNYTLDKLSFDQTYRMLPTLIIFQLAIVDKTGSTTAGRAIWIELPSLLKEINILKTEIGNVVSFDYPGEGKSLYIKRLKNWELVAPITTNMVWLAAPLHEISEIAIVDGTIDTGTILHRRKLNAYSITP